MNMLPGYKEEGGHLVSIKNCWKCTDPKHRRTYTDHDGSIVNYCGVCDKEHFVERNSNG